MDRKFVYVFGLLFFLVVSFMSFALGVSLGASIDGSGFKDFWIPVLSMIGAWVSGVGALAAVFVSLWLAHKHAHEDTEAIEGIFYPATDGRNYFYALKLVSKGKRPAKVQSVTLGGDGAKKHLFVAQWRDGSSKMPIFLNYGEDAIYLFRDDFESTIKNYVEHNLNGDVSRLRVIVSTTVKEYKIKPAL